MKTKFNTKWIIFTLLIWLIVCQGLFILIQNSIGQKVVESIRAQIRQELNTSDFNYLARSINDYTTSSSIRCSVLEKINPDHLLIINLKYMADSCKVNLIWLRGMPFDVNLTSMNGDIYRFQFISNNPIYFDIALWCFRVFGLILIYAIFTALSLKAEKELQELKLELEFANRMNEMALQVSHDIRSPLAALKVAIQDLVKTEEANNAIIKMAISRIEDIANNLLKKNKQKGEEAIQDESIVDLLESIILEKQTEFKKQKLNINFRNNNILKDVVVHVGQQNFKRVISNLVNNAQEAFVEGKAGTIDFSIELINSRTLLLKIKDNGKGIPQNIIEKLGTKGFSHGKTGASKSGSGIGLSHAMQMIKSYNGDLKIESQENIGTTISITLPYKKIASINDDFEAEKKLTLMTILIDDDDLVRLTWSLRAKKAGLNFIAYTKSEDAINNIHLFSKDSSFYIDSELKNEKGENVAKVLFENGFTNLYLATGHPKENFAHLNFIKDVITKKPPF